MKNVLALVVVVFLFVGCEPVPHYNRVRVASVTGEPVKVPPKLWGKVKPYGSVKLLQKRDEVTAPSEVIAIMSVQGERGEEAGFIDAFLHRAADLGADAIILDPPSVAFNQKEGIYRAEAIRFKSQP